MSASNSDLDAALANVRYLERETRQLRRTLLDEFAMAALTGLLAHHGDSGWHPDAQVQSMEGALETCYQYAQAALDVRKCPL